MEVGLGGGRGCQNQRQRVTDAVRKSGEPLPPLQGSPGSPASGLLVRGAGRLIVAPRLPRMSLPALKSCLVLFEKESAEASRSKTLSNSAEEPKSHFPHRAARGFSRRPGWAPGSPNLTRVVHAPSPASVSLPLEMEEGASSSKHSFCTAWGPSGAGGSSVEGALWLRERHGGDARPGHFTPGQEAEVPGPFRQRSSHTPSRSEPTETLSELNRGSQLFPSQGEAARSLGAVWRS